MSISLRIKKLLYFHLTRDYVKSKISEKVNLIVKTLNYFI